MQDDVIIEGKNISAMHRNFELLRKTVQRQGEIISDQERQIKALWGTLEKKRNSDGMVADFLAGGLRRKR